MSVKKISEVTRTSEKVLIFLLYSGLFIAGIFFHADDLVVSNIESIGWIKLLYLLGTFTFCFVLIWFVYKLFRLNKVSSPGL